MLTELRSVQSVLYWCFDKELYSSTQSTRSWAYVGEEHVTLRFTLPPLPREIAGLRLALQPCANGLTIHSMHFHSPKLSNTWNESDVKISGFGTLEARISPYAEPASTDIKSSCATIEANSSVLKALHKGGTLELVLSLSLSNMPSSAPSFNPELVLPIIKNLTDETGENVSKISRTPAVARELQEIHNEVMTLNALVKELYQSNTWKWTMWCRDLSAIVRRWILWKYYLLLTKKIRSLFNKPLKTVAFTSAATSKTDIIVPVHNGIDDITSCLSAVLESRQSADYELVVVDDASSDIDVIEYLDKLAAVGKIKLLRNKTNIGFTASVNQGMQLHTDRDVVLLNSDAVVANNWLDRLQRAAYFKKHIATVTPFSNNASICSYPTEMAIDEFPPGYDTKALDQLFATTNTGNMVRIPTAVGFCMYIKRSCLAQVGYFDSETFPGYGEENDFCMRAHKLGWWHVLAADTFVFHKGGSSYGESQHMRKRSAYDFLAKMHPEFQEIVNEFVRADSALPFRRNIDLKRLHVTQKPIILLALHGQGGGTEKHVLELAKFFGTQVDFLSLRVFGERAHLRWLNKGESFWQDFQMPTGYDELRNLLKSLPIQRIHVHHILGIELIIGDLIRDLGLPFDFTVHDFYTVCPRGWLCDHRQHYCGQPNEDGCNACLAVLPDPKTVSIQQWRKKYRWLVEEAQRVFVPSSDTLLRLKQYLPVANYVLASHLEKNLMMDLQPVPIQIKAEEPLRIVVLGLLNAEKGSDLLDACAIDACKRELPLEFHFLGAAHRPLSGRPRGALLIYGRYEDIDLQELLQQVRPHLAWFPAQCPETYSYTLSACLEAGLPVVAPDLGAFKERLAGRNWSWIRPWQQEPQEWNDFLVKIMDENFKTGIAPKPVDGVKPSSQFFYAKDYLQPAIARHAMPELQRSLEAVL
jgi:GT2 family glycosyltransferase/glycosyltransferase involved in cell wall biosynthesis